MAKSLRQRLYTIIFGTDTPAGKAFDVILLIAILLSVIAVMLESVPSLQEQFGQVFSITELVLTVAFTLEYITRIYVTEKKKKYIFSFYGILEL